MGRSVNGGLSLVGGAISRPFREYLQCATHSYVFVLPKAHPYGTHIAQNIERFALCFVPVLTVAHSLQQRVSVLMLFE